MTWAKIDDGLEEHDKVELLLDGHIEIGMLDGDALQELAALAALGLWTLALSNSARRLTDGHITRRVLRSLAPTTHSLLADRLVEVGLFDPRDEGGVEIHDYLDHNPSREKVLEQRAARAAAGRKGGEASGQSRREASAEAPAEAPAEAAAEANALAAAQADGKPERTPARTRTPIETSSPVGPERPDPGTGDPDVVRLSHLLADLICERDPKARSRVKPDGKRWLKAMRLLVADRQGDIVEVERVLRWSQADSFWQSNILSPDKLREKFVQLASKSTNGNGASRPAADPVRQQRRERRGSALREMLASTEGGQA